MSLGRQSEVPDGGGHHLVVSVVPGHFGVTPNGKHYHVAGSKLHLVLTQ